MKVDLSYYKVQGDVKSLMTYSLFDCEILLSIKYFMISVYTIHAGKKKNVRTIL